MKYFIVFIFVSLAFFVISTTLYERTSQTRNKNQDDLAPTNVFVPSDPYLAKESIKRAEDEAAQCRRSITKADILGVWNKTPTEGPTLQFIYKESEVFIRNIENEDLHIVGYWKFDEKEKYVKVVFTDGFIGTKFADAFSNEYLKYYKNIKNVIYTPTELSFEFKVFATKYPIYAEQCGLAFTIGGGIYDKVE